MNEIHGIDIKNIFEAQGENRWKIAQTSAKERIQKLKKLREAVVKHQEEFYEAVWQDFHKPRFEAWLSEIFPTIEEIDHTISHLKKWMKDKSASRVFFLPTSKSRLLRAQRPRAYFCAVELSVLATREPDYFGNCGRQRDYGEAFTQDAARKRSSRENV